MIRSKDENGNWVEETEEKQTHIINMIDGDKFIELLNLWRETFTKDDVETVNSIFMSLQKYPVEVENYSTVSDISNRAQKVVNGSNGFSW